MTITVVVTATDYNVSATEVIENINVTVDNDIFTITNDISSFTITNITPTITFTTDGTNGFDFASKFRGEWVSGTTYFRNDCVTWQDNFYVCQVSITSYIISTIAPSVDTTNWRLAVDVTSISTASITDLTVANLTVTNTLKLGPLYYPNVSGLYGQVLFTDGTQYANWTNLGDLVLWSLSEDLKTNGFEIRSNTSTNLRLKSGPSWDDYAYINIGTGIGNKEIDFWVDTNGSFNFTNGDISAAGSDLQISNIDLGNDLLVGGDIFLNGVISGQLETNPVKIGSGGIRFNDGTVQTSASTGSFSTSQIASDTVLGVIRVGNYLSINSGTGILSVNSDSLRNLGGWYTLPAASTSTRGGVRIGNGLEITNGDVLNVTTSTEFGNVSLTRDAYTNGFKLVYNASGGPYLDINSGNILLELYNNGLTINSSQINLGGAVDVVVESVGNLLQIKNIDGVVQLQSDYTEIGTSANTSTVRVQKIYNYAGSYGPEFPAGIQFGDGSVQVTAWQTSTLYQSSMIVDFDNPFDP